MIVPGLKRESLRWMKSEDGSSGDRRARARLVVVVDTELAKDKGSPINRAVGRWFGFCLDRIVVD